MKPFDSPVREQKGGSTLKSHKKTVFYGLFSVSKCNNKLIFVQRSFFTFLDVLHRFVRGIVVRYFNYGYSLNVR